MPTLEAMISVALAGLVLSATPGPSMLYILSRSVGQSRAAGMASAVGLGLGGVVLAMATALGLAALREQFDWLTVTLKYVGSAYLVWLGIGMIRDARETAQSTLEVNQVENQSLWSIMMQGILVELLNPKTVLFFAVFLPPFVTAMDGGTAPENAQLQLLLLGALVPLTAVPADLIVAIMGGTLAQSINRQRVLREGMAWGGGIILIGIAINLHF